MLGRPTLKKSFSALPVMVFVLTLAGCDAISQKLGIETAASKEADSKAVGGACRQSGRAIEDCYSVYSWLNKAFIFQGWQEMDAYMRENNLQTTEPHLPPVTAPPPPPPPVKKKTKAEIAAEKAAVKAAAKAAAAAAAAAAAEKNTPVTEEKSSK